MSQWDPTDRPDPTDPGELVEGIDAEGFAAWYRERQFARNIREGRPYFNGPSPAPPPERHSPSQLLQCSRKVTYRQENAPVETTDPDGLFWIGRRFEEDVVVPYLREAVVDESTYVRNSMWIDETVETEGGTLRFRGATDPVIVTGTSEPLVVTEVKTKRSIDGLTEPDPHHRAQVHAYMYGLSADYERDVGDAVLVYGDRTTLDITAFHETFDGPFWDDVLAWAASHSAYRRDGALPPDDPEQGWECDLCSYRHRCGRSDEPYADVGVSGFLPLFADYPRSSVTDYLAAHEHGKLTPTLASEHTDLAGTHGVRDWCCPDCDATFDWDAVPRDRTTPDPPPCPDCAERGVLTDLRPTPPAE